MATATLQPPNLMSILRLSYDNAKLTIDLQPTTNLQSISKNGKLFLGTIHMQNRLRQCFYNREIL